MLGNTIFISYVEHDILLVRCDHKRDIMFNTRNKYGISSLVPSWYYIISIMHESEIPRIV